MGKELLIVIPAYNEEKSIGTFLDSLKEHGVSESADILVVNDASVDATEKAAKSRGVPVLNLVFHMGYGSALKAGYRFALLGGYRYVVQMDADGQHDACNVAAVYERLRAADEEGKQADVVIASRFMKGSAPYSISAVRRAAFFFYRSIIRLAAGRYIHDPTSGMQGLGRAALEYFAGYRHFDDKYPDANIVLEMLLLGFRVEEIPAVMHKRMQGKGLHDGMEPVYYMLRMTLCVCLVILRKKELKHWRKEEGQHAGEKTTFEKSAVERKP